MSAAAERLLRYDPRSLRGDYLRAGIGLLFCAAAISLAGPTTVAGIIFGAGALVFVAFAGRTLVRHLQRYRLTEAGLHLVRGAPGQRPGLLRWSEMEKLRLRFFSTKRDRREGWMQLVLRSRSRRFIIDSTLEDFDAIARAAARAMLRRNLPLDRSSAANFAAMGIEVSEPETRPQ